MLIYNSKGRLAWENREHAVPPPSPIELPIPTIAGLVPVTEVMTHEVICAQRDLPVARVIELFLDNYLGCLPVVDDQGLPIGMITKRDLVEQLGYLVGCRSRGDGVEPAATAEDVMLPIALALDEHASLLQAAATMAVELVHHIPIVSSGRVIGVVTSLDVARWLARNDGMVTG